MKLARGPVIAPLPEAERSRMPRRLWVYRAVLGAIRSAALVPGDRLPSSRRLAAEWGVARGAVDEAFEQLQVEGLLERRVGDGTYVCAVLPPGLRAARAPTIREPSATTQAVLARLNPLLQPMPQRNLRPRALRPSMLDMEHFPLAAWKRCVSRSYDAQALPSTLAFGAPAGLDLLRELTARHVSLTLSLHCRAEQIVIVNSHTHACELISRVLLSPGDVVATEDPGHASQPRLLALGHLDVRGVPLDEQGLSVVALRERAPQAAAVFLSTFNQYPLGVATTAQRSAELMQWADESGAWIIDTHFQREVAHDAPPPPPLGLLDSAERVLVVGSFSAITFSSLRVAYVVVPERLVDAFVAVRGMLGDHTSVPHQAALASFMAAGYLSSHLRTIGVIYRERRDALRDAAARYLPQWVRWGPMAGGIDAVCHLPPSIDDVALSNALAKQGVGSVPLSRHAWQVSGCNGLVLGYGAYGAGEIDSAVRILGQLLRQAAP